jgi:hypothetical protein
LKEACAFTVQFEGPTARTFVPSLDVWQLR